MTNVLETFAFKLTDQDVKEILLDKREVEVNYANGDILCIKFEAGNHTPVGHIAYITVYYGDKDVVEGDIQYYRAGSTFYSVDHVDKAVKAFMARAKADNPEKVIDEGESFGYIATRANKVIHFDSHYTYIDEVGPYFLSYVYGNKVEDCKQKAQELSISSGRKAYQHYDAFIKGMVPFNRGALLMMLEFLEENGTTPIEIPVESMIENYHNKYSEYFDRAEQQLLDDVYLAN
jgi:hypothetical protein